MRTLVGIALIVSLAGFEAYILLRYPAFRRAFFAHWKPSAIVGRLEAYRHRLEARERELRRRP